MTFVPNAAFPLWVLVGSLCRCFYSFKGFMCIGGCAYCLSGLGCDLAASLPKRGLISLGERISLPKRLRQNVKSASALCVSLPATCLPLLLEPIQYGQKVISRSGSGCLISSVSYHSYLEYTVTAHDQCCALRICPTVLNFSTSLAIRLEKRPALGLCGVISYTDRLIRPSSEPV